VWKKYVRLPFVILREFFAVSVHKQMQSDQTREKTKAVEEPLQTTQTPQMEDNLKTEAETAGGAAAATTGTPSRKRYTRAQLMHLRDTIDLTAPPVGYNPALLKPVEPLNKDMQAPREGVKWNRSRSVNTWAGPPTGQKTGGMPPFSRLVEGGEDITNGPFRGGRALRSAISWNEQQSGAVPTPDKNFARRNSRSDMPGRWDNNKEDQLSRSFEKRGSERWPPYGHRDSKDKPPKPGKDDECIEHPSQDFYHHDLEPEWMNHRPSADNPERAKQQRQFAQDFEQERKMMREKGARDPKEHAPDREGTAIMTDEEINDFKKQLEAEERGVSSSSVFTFDSLKEAMKSQGVSNLPPMPTSGISTVDQIERSMKASANAQMPPSSMSDLERQKLELLRAVSGQGNVTNPATAAANIEGANRLLSMLRGQARPVGAFGNLSPPQQLQQPMGGIPVNLSQQPGLMAGGNTQLERLFGANPRVGAGFGPGAFGAQQQVHPGIGNVQLPFMQQQAGQFNQRSAINNSILSALLANQTQNRQKQAMLAHLQQAQQQTAMQNARAEAEGPPPESGEDDGEGRGNTEPPGVQPQPSMLGLIPGAGGPVQNQVQLPSFGLQGNLMGVRPSMPATPGMFNPSMVNVPVANPQSMFPGGIPQAMNPAGLGGHPGFFVQNGGGLQRPAAPGLSGMNIAGMRPGLGMGSVIDDRQVPVLNGQPNALQASLLAAQQGSSGGLNRFFGEHNVGVPGGFPTDQAGAAPVRNRSLEELKNEAQ